MAAVIPPECYCSITHEIAQNAVIGSDGFTYDEPAIREWLQVSKTSPMTRKYMDESSLLPNMSIRQMIQRFLDAQRGQAVVAYTSPKFKGSPSALKATTYNVGGEAFFHASVVSPPAGPREPVVLILMLDKSGSMGENACTTAESKGIDFTRWDLSVAAALLVGEVLNENDMLAVIVYSSEASIILPPTYMNDAGRAALKGAITPIHPDGGTNIFDAVRLAATIRDKPEMAGRNVAGMLLSDGVANQNPPRGIVGTLRGGGRFPPLPQKNPWTLHSFGFGYGIDSTLMSAVAEWGKGIFGFIPDCSLLASVMVNALATILASSSMNEKLVIRINADEPITIHTGALQYGQPRDYVFPIRADSVVEVSMNDGPFERVANGAVPAFAHAQFEYIKAITDALPQRPEDNAYGLPPRLPVNPRAINTWYQKYQGSTGDPRILELVQDAAPGGQINMAPTYFDTWGEHYMRSYHVAQKLQHCLNFKDPGVNIYGGVPFQEYQALADGIFNTMPPPKASKRGYGGGGGGGGGYMPPPQSMAVFNNASGGCFVGTCRIRMADGQRRQIIDLKVGELVWTPVGGARVKALVKMGSKKTSQLICKIGDLELTPWHPIRVNGVWVHPASLVPKFERPVSVVYNLVLDYDHIVDIEGTECITLGHGFTEPVAEHPFFGSMERITAALRLQPGWDTGYPVYKNLVAVNDPHTGLITGWRDE